MRFSELLADLALHGVTARRLTPPGVDPEIAGLSQDSRGVAPGELFVAVLGMRTDAHELLGVARAAGAAAFLLQRQVPLPEGSAAAIVEDTRMALGVAASSLAGHPSEELAVIGITGTDGKTTTSLLTVEALLASGVKAGGMNSLEFRCLDEVEPNPTYLTTLDSPVIQARLRRLLDAGVTTAVLETTSHGIAQHRLSGVAFDIAAYTNLTHEHLDFHGTLAEYRDVKLRLAEMARQSPRKPGVPKAIVFNADEPAWESLRMAPTDRRVTWQQLHRRPVGRKRRGPNRWRQLHPGGTWQRTAGATAANRALQRSQRPLRARDPAPGAPVSLEDAAWRRGTGSSAGPAGPDAGARGRPAVRHHHRLRAHPRRPGPGACGAATPYVRSAAGGFRRPRRP